VEVSEADLHQKAMGALASAPIAKNLNFGFLNIL